MFLHIAVCSEWCLLSCYFSDAHSILQVDKKVKFWSYLLTDVCYNQGLLWPSFHMFYSCRLCTSLHVLQIYLVSFGCFKALLCSVSLSALHERLNNTFRYFFSLSFSTTLLLWMPGRVATVTAMANGNPNKQTNKFYYWCFWLFNSWMKEKTTCSDAQVWSSKAVSLD